MSRSILFAAAWTMISGLAASADEPQPDATKPPYERLLQGDDAKKAAEIGKKIEQAGNADRYQEAIEFGEEMVAFRTKTQGSDHWQTVNARWDLEGYRKVARYSTQERAGWRKASVQGIAEAEQLFAKGDYATAQTRLEEYGRWCKNILGEKHPAIAASYANLAFNLAAQQKYAEAQALHEQALAIRRELLGEIHPQTASSYQSIALNLSAQRKYAEAQTMDENALHIHHRVFGERHPETAISLHNLANNLMAQGKHVDAERHYQSALELSRELHGEKHPFTAQCFNQLGLAMQAQGKYDAAQTLLQKALTLSRELYGEKNEHTAMAYNNLAVILVEEGKYADAQPVLEAVLLLCRELFGEKHPKTAKTLNNLAENLRAQGKYADAKPVFEKALDISRELLGESNEEIATIYSNLATNLKDQGNYVDAQSLYEKALEIFRKVLGEKHPNTIRIYNNLASNLEKQADFASSTLEAQRNFTDAQGLYQKALDLKLDVLGEMHPDTARGYNNLALSLKRQGKYAEAQPLYEKALDLWHELLGEKHPLTAFGYNNLAQNMAAQRKSADAQSFYEKAIDLRQEILGENHPETLMAYSNFAYFLAATGKHADCLLLLTKATASYEMARMNVAGRGLERAVFGAESSPYRLVAVAQAQLLSPEAAWAAAENDLARGLSDEVATDKGAALTADEQNRQATLTTELNRLQPRILQLVTNIEPTSDDEQELTGLQAHRNALEIALAKLAAGVSQREVASLSQVQGAIPSYAAMVLWVDVSGPAPINEHWGCVVRRKGDPIWERLPGTGPKGEWTDDDDSLSDRLRAALVSGTMPVGAFDALAQKLYAQRLAPLTKHLDGVKTLYTAAVHEMSGIPIEVLTRNYTISYVPSGTFLAQLSDRSPASDGGLLALGDPVFNRPDSEANSKPASELPPGGLLITQVAPGGAAAKARLQGGDVLVRYGETELNSVEQLTEAMQAQAGAKEVPITVWREGVQQPFTRNVPPGKLGIAMSKEPAREAIASRRQGDTLLAGLRGGDWNDLPGTRVELTQLASLFGPQATTLVDSAASEQALEKLRTDENAGLSQFRYLHFATHGEANDVRAFESVLILAQDTLPADPLPRAGEPFINGQLSANEVLEFWHLNADLVTLSACETALGRKGGGDGLLGFAQAFLKAGSRAVCLSLWKVDDTATSLLMTRFYQNLLDKREGLDVPMPKAAALAEAKEWLRELSADEALKLTAVATNSVVRGTRGKGERFKLTVPAMDAKQPGAKNVKPFADPRFWSAFILIGDPN